MDQDLLRLEREDVERVLTSSRGNTIFQNTLEVSTAQEIGPLLMHYICFNRFFGAGVAHLSSQIAIQPFFRDSQEELQSLER
ncbi:TPA: hypothetical protein HA241_02985 [Candidatus Woesearchaeota archaeon]|nr:hypothetical protein [Candidatus Woesearchaeota archaeon]